MTRDLFLQTILSQQVFADLSTMLCRSGFKRGTIYDRDSEHAMSGGQPSLFHWLLLFAPAIQLLVSVHASAHQQLQFCNFSHLSEHHHTSHFCSFSRVCARKCTKGRYLCKLRFWTLMPWHLTDVCLNFPRKSSSAKQECRIGLKPVVAIDATMWSIAWILGRTLKSFHPRSCANV